MTLKEHIHQLGDSLPDDDHRLQAAERLLESNGAESKPDEVVDDWGNLSAVTEAAAGDLMDRLAEEEAAAGLDPW